MQSKRPLLVTMIIVVGAQFLASSPGWCANSQGSTGTQAFQRRSVSGLRGDVSVTSRDGRQVPIRFHDTVNNGDEITTGAGGMVEIIINKQALVTANEETTLKFSGEPLGYTEVELTKGDVQIAISRGDQALKVQTPTVTALTYGGLLTITVTQDKQGRAAARRGNDVSAIRPIANRDDIRTGQQETFHVLEGRIQVHTASASSSITVETGQGLEIVAGQIKGVTTMLLSPMMPVPLPASEHHAITPARGIEEVATRERAEAEALQHVLLGTTSGTPRNIEIRNVLLATSFGMPNALQGQTQQPPLNPANPSNVTGTVIPQPTQVSPNLSNVVISTSVGVQLPDSPQQPRGPQPPAVLPATPPALPPPSPPSLSPCRCIAAACCTTG